MIMMWHRAIFEFVKFFIELFRNRKRTKQLESEQEHPYRSNSLSSVPIDDSLKNVNVHAITHAIATTINAEICYQWRRECIFCESRVMINHVCRPASRTLTELGGYPCRLDGTHVHRVCFECKANFISEVPTFEDTFEDK